MSLLGKELTLREADLKNVVPIPAIGVVGKRRAGKTTFGKWIAYELRDRNIRFMAMCGNKENKSEWSTMIHPLYVVDKSTAHIQRIIDWQDSKVKIYTDNRLDIPKELQLTLIIDDCGSDEAFMRSKTLKDLFSNGRHYGITIIIILQDLMQLQTQNRAQIDYLGVLTCNNDNIVKKIRTEFCSACNERTFRYIFKSCTEGRGMCWIDNTGNGSSISDSVFFKNLTPGDINNRERKLGSREVRDFAKRHFIVDRELAAADSDCDDTVERIQGSTSTFRISNSDSLTIRKEWNFEKEEEDDDF